MLKASQAGAEDIDRKLLSIFPANDRRSVLDCLASLASEMDKVDDAEPEHINSKVKLKRKPIV